MKTLFPMKLFRFAACLCALMPGLVASAETFDRWCDSFAEQWLRADPQAASALQYFSGAEQDALDRQLTPITREARAARLALARRGLAELNALDRASLDATQRISAATLDWQLDEVARTEPFADYAFVFQQYSGLQVQLVNFLSQTHPIRNRRDVENYLARLKCVAGQMDEGIAQAKERAARGILPPKFILTSTLQQLDRFLAPPAGQNVLVTSLDERAAKVKDLSAADRAKFLAAAEEIVHSSILPGFQRARALLQEQLPRSTDDAGLWRFPNGDKAYAEALRRFTTTSFTPSQIHQLGLKEAARIEEQMDKLFRQLGYSGGTIQERMNKLEADSQPPMEPDPRPALLAKYEAALRDAENRAGLLFDLRPKAPVVVKREPAFTEKNAACHYTSPAPDNSRPGIFWVPLPGAPFRISEMRTLVYHEAVPGHHFQIALQSEMPGLPRFRRERVFGSISAHSEGWALYAEQLALESGWYKATSRGNLAS